MNETILYLREEILLYNTQMFLISVILLVLMTVLLQVGRRIKDPHGFLIVMVLDIGWIFAVARYEFLIHRAGAYIRQIEAAGGWESSAIRHGNQGLLPFIDIMAALPFLFILVVAGHNQRTHGGKLGTIWVCYGLFLIGIITAIYSAAVWH